MTEKSKRKRSPQDNIRPIILHLTISFIFLAMLIYTYIQARMPLNLTVLICSFQLICAGIFAASGMTHSDWKGLRLLTPAGAHGEQLPSFPLVLIMLMTFLSLCSLSLFASSQVPVFSAWSVILALGVLFLPYFIAHEMFQLGRAIAINQQQKSKPLEVEDNHDIFKVEDRINDLDTPSYKEQLR